MIKIRIAKRHFIILLTFFFSIGLVQSYAQHQWNFYENTNFKKYKDANEGLESVSNEENRVVFMGNSITEAWPVLRPDFFKNSNYIGRGISGQTTPQMLLRFRKDVINLNPKVVVILAGINDIAGNTGFTPIETIAENIMSMAELARCNDIEVILCSVLPALDFPWSPGLEPADKVIELNIILQNYARQNGIPYVDYHSAMKDDNNGLKVPEYTTADDLVHPNAAGYVVMEQLVQPVIEQALIASALSLNPLFTDHMVLQQNEAVTIWGEASSGEEVRVSGSWGKEATTIADDDGNWELNLSTPRAGGPYHVSITSAGKTISINDVMIGEVWLASGQSNMQMPLRGWPPNDPIKNSEEEIANAQYPDIRMFTVNRNYSMKEERSFKGQWEICTPETAREFSATAYFFARRLHKELNVPIGITHSSWGGTPAEAWTSKKSIKTLGDFDEIVAKMENPEREKVINGWYGKCKKRPYPNQSSEWDNIDLDDLMIAEEGFVEEGWSSMEVPGRLDLYNDQDIDGVFWFRKVVELEDISSDYTFVMGPVDDTDAVFFNGEKIGGTVNNYSDLRNYPIPVSLLKKGKNTIAIRVIDTGGPGSINGGIKLTNGKGVDISLSGNWNYKITAEFFQREIYVYDPEKTDLTERPEIVSPSPYSTPSCLYNAMIHPLAPYSIKGAIWYQGESNVGRAEQYQRLFPTMIKDWRTKWASDFPFYFVQIAPFRYNRSGDETLDKSQKLREAQRKTLSLDKTGMVVTLDIGNNTNIHPANKQDVGSRLAGLALANDYGKDITASGPLYKRHTIEGGKVLIEFDYVGGGLLARDGMLTGFEIAGGDKNYVPAVAEIADNKVQVFESSISEPKYVRYAWRDTSVPSLFNREGLPASSFITKD